MNDPLRKLSLTFHHFGLAVKDPKAALCFLESIGYSIDVSGTDLEQNVNYIFCVHSTSPTIEIVYPTSVPGVVDKLAARHPSGIIYHPCYVTDDREKLLADMQELGLRFMQVSAPKPGVAFGGRDVSFYQVLGIGLIEIIV